MTERRLAGHFIARVAWDQVAGPPELPDFAWEITAELNAADLLDGAKNVTFNGEGFVGLLSQTQMDQLAADPDFAHGKLYAFHTKDVPGANQEYRSYKGSLGDGSLQVVINTNTGQFYADVDRFNVYQDVVNILGHTFLEVIPGLFKK